MLRPVIVRRRKVVIVIDLGAMETYLMAMASHRLIPSNINMLISVS